MSIVQSLLTAIVATALLGLGLWVVWRIAAWLQDRLEVPGVAVGESVLGWVRYARALLSRVVLLGALFISAGMVYGWLISTLVSFEPTRGFGERLGGVFGEAAQTVLEGILGAIPGLVVVAVIVLIAQAAVEASNAVFRAVSQRELRIRVVHPETASATRRLVALAIWAIALVVAYPYLPGYNSEVF